MNDTTLAPWPACWLFVNRGDDKGNLRRELGARTTINDKNGALTYTCSCGSAFTRAPGFLITEARAWVADHAPHVA